MMTPPERYHQSVIIACVSPIIFVFALHNSLRDKELRMNAVCHQLS
jgi:hypothetical protein